jgi:hypothetical protein
MIKMIVRFLLWSAAEHQTLCNAAERRTPNAAAERPFILS